MICDPPEQSAGQIAVAIGASRASLTTSLRLLMDAGFVERHRKPGERTVFYRIDDGAWHRVVQRQIAAHDPIPALGVDATLPQDLRRVDIHDLTPLPRIPTALARFDRQRRRRTQSIARNAHRTGQQMVNSSRLGYRFTTLALRATPSSLWNRLTGPDSNPSGHGNRRHFPRHRQAHAPNDFPAQPIGPLERH